jgi:hypothetical protein
MLDRKRAKHRLQGNANSPPTMCCKNIQKDERCRRTPGWNEVHFAIYYVLNNRHNEIN